MVITVLQHSPERTVLFLKPVKLFAYWGFGLLFIAMGVGVVQLLARRVEFRCDAAWCVLTRSEPLVTRRDSVERSRMRGAQWIESTSLGFIRSRTVVVFMGDRPRPLALVGADGAAKDSLVAEINAVAGSLSAPGVTIREDYRLLGWAFGLFVAAGGLVMILVIEMITLTVDMPRDRVRIRSMRRLGLRTVEFPLSDVAGLEVREFAVRQAVSYSVAFRLAGDREVPVARTALFTAASANQLRTLLAPALRAPRRD